MIECEEKEKSQCLSRCIWHLKRFGDVINIKVQLTYSCFSAHCPKISAMSGPKFRKFPVCHCVSFSLHFTVLLQNYEQDNKESYTKTITFFCPLDTISP